MVCRSSCLQDKECMIMNNELTMELLISALRDDPRAYVDLVQGRLNWHLDETDGLWYVENCDDSIDLIADSRRLFNKDLLVLAINNGYDPNEDYVNSDLVTVSATELADMYIDNMDDIWELLSDSDKEYIMNELTELTRDEDSISYYIEGTEEDIESLISIAEGIAVKKVTGDKKALLFKERNGAKISYKDGCLYVIKKADKDNLMRVRKEVNGYATWIKYYYPDGEEELVYYKKN